jgi:putative ubiquitin-RnfH superfamily antitoxin RatB of RatAB toxin-antitoxin module
MAVSEGRILVEVVFARPGRQSLVEVYVGDGATVGEAIAASGIDAAFPDVVLDELPVGIWGRLAERSTTVRFGDRIEIYRPLELDPKAARRELAAAGLTMKDARERD